MNGEQQGRDGRGEDPVDQFFAAHRAQVRDEPADDLTWHRIRETRHRGRSGRRGAWTGALVAAAAALAIVVGPSLLPDAQEADLAGPQPSTTQGQVTATEVQPTQRPSAEESDAPTSPEDVGDPSTVATPAPEGGMPENGWFTDVTTAGSDGQGRLALVATNCAATAFCPTLVSTADGGATWQPEADLQGLGLVDRVVFADRDHGWAWGDKAPLWTTTDGGSNWQTVEFGADAVMDLSVWGDVLVATTLTYDTQPCNANDCPQLSGAVVQTDPMDTDWRDNVVDGVGPVEESAILETSDTRYLALRQDLSGPVSTLLRWQDGTLEGTAPGLACEFGPREVIASWSAPEQLYALCEDERGLALQESDTGGRTWQPSTVRIPTFVLGERVPLAGSQGAGHLLLVGDGNYSVTTDGGRTWSGEKFLPEALNRPDRVEVLGPDEIVVYPSIEQGGDGLGYWLSRDGGLTWQIVDPRG